MLRLAFLICTLAISSCEPVPETATGPEPCSEEWFQSVEDELTTADSQGHGPDLGSAEWRSVVEFKLGIRGDPTLPDRETSAWCVYIDETMSSRAD